jgi:HSP20 family molecular chaperone IbpA
MERKDTVSQEAQEAGKPALMPPVDVIEDEKGITLCADLPGVPKDKLAVHIDGETLVIEGEMGLEMPREMEATHVEVSVPRYRRVFTLSRELDPERLSAELKGGILRLRIEKAAHAVPRRIEVQAG